MDLFDALILKQLVDRYLKQYRNTSRSWDCSDLAQDFAIMIDSARETLREDLTGRDDYRDAVEMADQARDAFYQSR